VVCRQVHRPRATAPRSTNRVLQVRGNRQLIEAKSTPHRDCPNGHTKEDFQEDFVIFVIWHGDVSRRKSMSVTKRQKFIGVRQFEGVRHPFFSIRCSLGIVGFLTEKSEPDDSANLREKRSRLCNLAHEEADRCSFADQFVQVGVSCSNTGRSNILVTICRLFTDADFLG